MTNDPMLSDAGRMLVTSVTEDYDHAKHRKCCPNRIQTHALEQGQADRRKATAAAKARLVDPDQAAGRRATPRLGNVQSGHRQQAAWLRCRRSQGRRRRTERVLSRPGDSATEENRAACQVRIDRADPTSDR